MNERRRAVGQTSSRLRGIRGWMRVVMVVILIAAWQEESAKV